MESFKGNHKKSSVFVIPRPPRKRGEKVSLKGISSEQVCIACAIDKQGNIVSLPTCKGKINAKTLNSVYASKIDKTSVLCTDKHRNSIQFAKDLGMQIIQLKSGKSKQGLYHIQHINAYHSNLKAWLYHFKGISTKRSRKS